MTNRYYWIAVDAGCTAMACAILTILWSKTAAIYFGSAWLICYSIMLAVHFWKRR